MLSENTARYAQRGTLCLACVELSRRSSSTFVFSRLVTCDRCMCPAECVAVAERVARAAAERIAPSLSVLRAALSLSVLRAALFCGNFLLFCLWPLPAN
jgi:hypothetical protein